MFWLLRFNTVQCIYLLSLLCDFSLRICWLLRVLNCCSTSDRWCFLKCNVESVLESAWPYSELIICSISAIQLVITCTQPSHRCGDCQLTLYPRMLSIICDHFSVWSLPASFSLCEYSMYDQISTVSVAHCCLFSPLQPMFIISCFHSLVVIRSFIKVLRVIPFDRTVHTMPHSLALHLAEVACHSHILWMLHPGINQVSYSVRLAFFLVLCSNCHSLVLSEGP